MHRRIATMLVCCGVLLATGSAAGLASMIEDGPDLRSAASSSLLKQARKESPFRYRFARSHGARIGTTPDKRSFFLYWPGQQRGGKAIVTLHGYFRSALDDFAYWHQYAAPRGYSVLALHWRLGRTSSEVYSPGEMYGQVTRILRAHGVEPGNALLHGYSAGAVRTYAVAALDRRSARYFRLFVANAGGAHTRIPFYGRVFGDNARPRSLGGTNWVLFCGGRDRLPTTGCPIMSRTSRLIRDRGGSTQLIAPDGARHGGFLAEPQFVGAALDAFERLGAPVPPPVPAG